MQINITARHGHLSAESQEKIREKVEKLRRLYDRISAIDVMADLEHRDAPSVELRLTVERNENVLAAQSSPSVMAALDGAIHKAEQQLRRHKDKRRDRHAQGLGRAEGTAELEPEEQ